MITPLLMLKSATHIWMEVLFLVFYWPRLCENAMIFIMRRSQWWDGPDEAIH
jgi:hypothetical protein